MKKILIILGICFLVIGMPAMTASPLQKLNHVRNQLPIKNPSAVLNNDTPPDWAAGNFSGVWGLNLLGFPLPASGWVEGYFANKPGLGRLEASFAEFNVTNATGLISGFMLWIFFMGGVSSVATGNGTWVSGIGVANETHFYWRLSAITGPSYYIHCEYSKFEE